MYQSTNHQSTTLPILAITTLAAFLRLFRADAQGLWLDEAFSAWMAGRPVAEMLGWLVRIDQHPPLYYALLHVWIRLTGDGEVALRALSALCGTLTVPVIYLLGRRLADKNVGLLAALILAASPFHVRFAQEARMYTLLALNACAALYALARLLTDPRAATAPPGRQLVDSWRAWRTHHRWPRVREIETDLAWLAYAVFTAAALWTHNAAIFLPIAANLLLAALYLFRRLRPPLSPSPLALPSLRSWLLAQLSVLLLWGPWIPTFVAQSVGVDREFWLPSPTWQTVVDTLGAFVSDFLPLPLAGLYGMGVLSVGLFVLGLVYFRRRPARAALLLVAFATPLAGELLVSLRRPIFYDRTLIWASLPLYLLLAAGLRQQLRLQRLCRRQFCRWAVALAAAAALLMFNGLSLHQYYRYFEKEQWDDAAAYVAKHVQPGDLILFNATWTQIPFDYYLHRLCETGAPAEHGAPVDLFDRGILEPKMAESDLPRLRALVRDHTRTWLVYSHNWYADPGGLIPRALGEELTLLEQQDFYGLQVRLYIKEDSTQAP